jgi:hypothetical protein
MLESINTYYRKYVLETHLIDYQNVLLLFITSENENLLQENNELFITKVKNLIADPYPNLFFIKLIREFLGFTKINPSLRS